MSKDEPQDDRTAAQATSAPADAGVGAAVPPPLPLCRDAGNALPIGTRLGEFELQSVAGEGGFSIVYRAWDHTLDRPVAVKEYFPSGMVARAGGTQVVVRSDRHAEAFEAGLRSFVEEARLLAKFDHPALVKVYRFWRANGSAYMVMPFCEGITLRDAWRAGAAPPDEPTLMQLLDPLTDALAVLHAERWYHRDIAPDNVMLLAGSGRPLLLDFGAARQVIGDLTHALTVILKPGYAPIEQWGEVPGMQQGPWTDVYALGAMIHFAITGSTPPPSVGRLVNDGYEPLARVAAGRYSESFLQAIDHALAVRPEQRTASIAQFRQEIGLPASASGHEPVSWMPTRAATRPVDTDPEATRLQPGPAARPAAGPATHAEPAPATEADIAFTVRPGALAAQAAMPARAPLPTPASGGRHPARLLLAGLLATAALGAGGYWWLRSVPPSAPQTMAPVPATAMSPAGSDGPSAEAAPATRPVAAETPAPAPVPPAHDADEDFQRIVAAQTPGHEVEVTLVRTTLRSEKDGLEFTVRARRDGYLYVFNRGSDGALLQLYPNRISGLLRVQADKPLDLPDDKVEFKIAGASGPNQLLVMVSTLRRDHAGLPARDEGGFMFYPTGSAAAALSARLPGPLPWIAGKPVCTAGTPCRDTFGATIAPFHVVQ